jgi:hypothetical protein
VWHAVLVRAAALSRDAELSCVPQEMPIDTDSPTVGIDSSAGQLIAEMNACVQVVIDARAALWKALPPAQRGPVLHHMTEVLHRVTDATLILRRLSDGRAKLSRENVTGEPVLSSTHRELQLDSESLMLFGAILLDQWAHAFGYVVAVSKPTPENFAFHDLVLALDDAKVSDEGGKVLQQREREHARWLDFWLRTYRNKFLVHAKRERQRNAIADVAGPQFELFTVPLLRPDEEVALSTEVFDLWHLAPEWLKTSEQDYWERQRPGRVLGRIVENIGAIGVQADRERIASVAERMGITAPTFQVLGSALAQFLSVGTRTLADWATSRDSSCL